MSPGFIIQTLIVAYLLLVEPFCGRRLYAALIRRAETDPTARSRFYRRIMLIEWGLTALALVSLLPSRVPLALIGLRAWPTWPNDEIMSIGMAASAGILAGLAFQVVLLRFSPKFQTAADRQLGAIRALLPTTRAERWQFAAVSITAGICEEILYRGLLNMYLVRFFPLLPFWGIALIAAACFGLGHLYQGWKGVLATGALGAGFTFLYLYSGSLLLPMLLHAAIDLRVLLLAPSVRWVATDHTN